jgi:hypothetical protein
MKAKISIMHQHLNEWNDTLALHSYVTAICVEEGYEWDVYEVEFNFPMELFHLGQSYGLKVGYKITYDAFK